MKSTLLKIALIFFLFSCSAKQNKTNISSIQATTDTDSTQVVPKIIQTGAEQVTTYLPLLRDKKIALVVNQTSTIKATHLVDSLINLGIDIKTIFAPEHGFRGNADAGEHVKDGIDTKTKLPIISLYGKNKKPYTSQLEGIDIVIFDIQDVGARFYTYISTMHYIMEACAENNKQVLILDRPNPNGDNVSGPILDTAKYRSFVGMHPIPIVHGCTVGELANMINNEGWLKNSVKCNLKIIPMLNYTHDSIYTLPIKPSPNLPNHTSIRLYPSLCILEPTDISIGRGTYEAFTITGIPYKIDTNSTYEFIPKSINGMSKYPKHQDKTCFGYEVNNWKPELMNVGFSPSVFQYYYTLYKENQKEKTFITSLNFLKKLVGNDAYVEYLKNPSIGYNHKEINDYILLRKKYLLYPDSKKIKPIK